MCMSGCIKEKVVSVRYIPLTVDDKERDREHCASKTPDQSEKQTPAASFLLRRPRNKKHTFLDAILMIRRDMQPKPPKQPR
jgi:hypothetical protein